MNDLKLVKMPGIGDYECFAFDNTPGDPRADDPADYERSPYRRENCASFDQQEESGCIENSRHFVSVCPSYTKLSRDEEMEQFRSDLYHARQDNERLQEENKKLRRIVHVWAENWRQQVGIT